MDIPERIVDAQVSRLEQQIRDAEDLRIELLNAKAPPGILEGLDRRITRLSGEKVQLQTLLIQPGAALY